MQEEGCESTPKSWRMVVIPMSRNREGLPKQRDRLSDSMNAGQSWDSMQPCCLEQSMGRLAKVKQAC